MSPVLSQSSLMLPQVWSRNTACKGSHCFIYRHGVAYPRSISISRETSGHQRSFLTIATRSQQNPFLSRSGVVSDSTASNLIVETTTSEVDNQPDNDGGGFGGDNGGRDDSGGGGGDDGGNDSTGDEGSDENQGSDNKRAKAILMSQKFTLGYAALVGLGGLMGFLKGGSQKSLAAGGLSAGLLYYVYTQLPTKPVFASAVGLGLSAALLVVMGSRFKKSRKIFPAGIVSFVSLIMTGGYLHGIMRTAH